MARKVTRKEYMKTLKKGASTNISQTQWKEKVAGKEGKAGRLYGPKGKLYTGRVQMSDGSIAVYKEGKRIGYRGKGLTSTAKKPTTATKTPTGPNKTKTKSALSMAERKKMQEGRKNWQSGARRDMTKIKMGAEGPRRSMPKGKTGGSTVSIPGGVSISLTGSGKPKSKHKKGDRRRVSPFSTQMEVFDGTRWVKEKK